VTSATVQRQVVLAIDIGASGVKSALIDVPSWSIGYRFPTADIHKRTFDELRSAVEHLLAEAIAVEPALQRVGISTTGSAGHDDVVISSGFYAGYQNINWLEILRPASRGRIRVARVLNDGRAAAYGTYLSDRRANNQHLVHFVVGTGIGGGMVSGGVLFNGSHNFAGAYGHIKVDTESTATCVCGGRGCVELFAAAPAVARLAAERGIQLQEPGGRGVRELSALALAGSEPAREAFQHAGGWLGVAIACVANVCDPAIVTVGGGVVAAAQNGSGGNWYVDAAARAARGMVIPRIAEHLTVVEASLLNDAALIGAAALSAAAAFPAPPGMS
jgi:glucokinase